MSKIVQTDEFDQDDPSLDGQDPTPTEDPTDDPADPPVDPVDDPADPTDDPVDPPADPVEPPKTYAYGDRQLTADELYRESILLQGEFTRRSQELAELKNPKKDTDDPLSKYDPTQVEEFKKLAKGAGFISKDEFEQMKSQETEKQVLSNFTKEHPEYNDPIKQKELFGALRQYNTSLEFLDSSLKRAHEDITSDPVKKAIDIKLNRATNGSGNGAGNPKTEDKFRPDQIEVMKKMGVYD